MQVPIEGTVTVWQIALPQPPRVVEQAAQLLSADETARAARFYFDRDRHHYIVARAALRQLLGQRLGLAPEAVSFQYGPAGKPALAPAQATPSLSFNLSHSHELALVALADGAELGVDVEYWRDLPDLLDLARRFFSPREAARLLALPAAEQRSAFFRCWTRKEAYLKARGDGLAGGLSSFDVAFETGQPPALLRTLDNPSEAARWSLLDVTPAPLYAGAVAVAAQQPRLSIHHWSFTE